MNRNLKFIFCIFLFAITFIFTICVLVIRPKKINSVYLYDTLEDTNIETLQKRIVQKMKLDIDNITAFNVYLDDDSIMGCNFHVNIFDNERTYFSQDISNYKSNILYIPVGYIKNVSNKEMILEIDLYSCDKIKAGVGVPLNKDSHLVSNSNKTLKIVVNTAVNNNSFYWYIAVMFVFAFTLLPLTRREK